MTTSPEPTTTLTGHPTQLMDTPPMTDTAGARVKDAPAQDPRGSVTLSRVGRMFRRLGGDTAYLLVSFPLAVASFSITVSLVSAGAGLLVVVVGFPLLTLTAYVARGFAFVERLSMRTLLGLAAPSPSYAPRKTSDGWVMRVIRPMMDPQSWLDVVFTVVSFATATAGFVIAVTWWSVSLGGLAYPLWGWALPDSPDNQDVPELLGFGHGFTARVVFYVLTGLVFTLLLPFVMRLVALFQSGVSRVLLCSRAGLQHQVENLTQSRAAARSAESTALRRLERDIHDGPQQRLVRLSMDLGRAGKQLDKDPSAARATIEGAIGQARETLDELRALSRGIAPPVLVDRGLIAALEEITARSTIPARLDVAATLELPEHVETATYFVVSEALTNVAKHSGASSVDVSVRAGEGVVIVSVTDNGAGGAHLSKGRGLVGLSDRVRAVDGILNLSSPAGGPTVVSAEIPCES